MWHSQGLETSVWPCFRGVFTPERPAAQVTIDHPPAFWPYFSRVFLPSHHPCAREPSRAHHAKFCKHHKTHAGFVPIHPTGGESETPGKPADAKSGDPGNDPRDVARTTPPPPKRRHKALQTQGPTPPLIRHGRHARCLRGRSTRRSLPQSPLRDRRQSRHRRPVVPRHRSHRLQHGPGRRPPNRPRRRGTPDHRHRGRPPGRRCRRFIPPISP